jgi:sialate O-acetylesterase
MKTLKQATILSLLITFICVSTVFADVKLPHVLGSNMVLQRDMPVPVWGWADAREQVTITLGDHEATTTADADGNWRVTLPMMAAGGPHKMTVNGDRNTIELTDILVGEVWVCSGQSNMQWSVRGSNDSEKEIAEANYPMIRLFHVPRKPSGLPADDVNAAWRATTPETVEHFSAVAYFFGRKLHKTLDVPIGLIHTSWGGTRIEPWTPPAGFASAPKVQGIHQQIQLDNEDYRNKLGQKLDEIEVWVQETRTALAENKRILPMPENRHPLNHHTQPTGLYNGMVHPLVPFGIRGAIWYQGESNLQDGMMYHEKMKALINGWRTVWGQGDFPFYFVQLAPFNYRGEHALLLPQLWEAQSATLSVPNTGMVVTTDIGNTRDIHPRNKQDVGKRLGLWALAKTYHGDVVYSGPLYKSMQVDGQKIRISFDTIGGGLVSRDNQPLTWFEIADNSGNFVKAQAEIAGDEVVVWSDTISEPTIVRFGWHQEAEPNLMNEEGLPASPFRTDRW